MTGTEEPVDGEEGGGNVGNDTSNEDLSSGSSGEEETLGSGNKHIHEIGNGDFHIDHGGNLLVLQLRNVESIEHGVTLIVDVQMFQGLDQQNNGSNGVDGSQNDGQDEQLDQVPLLGVSADNDLIIGNGQDGTVIQDGDDDQRDNGQDESIGDIFSVGLATGVNEVSRSDEQNTDGEEEQQLDGTGDTVGTVVLHSLEDSSGDDHSVNDDGQSRGSQHNIGSSTSGVSGTIDGNTNISSLQGGSIVDTITSHTGSSSVVLHLFDNIELMFGEHLSETVSIEDDILNSGTVNFGGGFGFNQKVGVVDLFSHFQLLGGFDTDGELITSNHSDGDTHSLGSLDGGEGIISGGIEQTEQTEHDPFVLFVLLGDTKSSETSGGIGLNLSFDFFLDQFTVGRHSQHNLRGTLAGNNLLSGLGVDGGGFDSLSDGIERNELFFFPAAQVNVSELSGVIADTLVDGILSGVHSLGSQSGGHFDFQFGVGDGQGDGNGVSLTNIGVLQFQGVLGEGTGLIGAEDLHTSQFLNGGKTTDNSLLFGQYSGSNSHSGGADDLHGNRN
mmetsp:Transcript_15684/g.17438  ORF Transcript_15684/g.17438 Transcript_15684/m.17438 type:complete len:555 (-) Transcript_15684:537-2201(-)